MEENLAPQTLIELGPQQGPQELFLQTEADIAFIGGQAGGGKTASILLDFLRHYGTPKVNGIAFRRTMPEITNPGALWDESKEFYSHLATPLEHKHQWNFPGNSKLKMSHMQHDDDCESHQGSAYAVIYFEELTHFTRRQFFYLMGRNRSRSGIKPYMRASLNPDPDHFAKKEFIQWYLNEEGFADPAKSGVLRYFVADDDTLIWGDTREELATKIPPKRVKDIKSFTFIPAKLEDNKILMEKDPGYESNLENLPFVERMRLRHGNWNIRPKAGLYFNRRNCKVVDVAPIGGSKVRFWDFAATEQKSESHDPDWTVGTLMQKTPEGRFIIHDVCRFRGDPLTVENSVMNITQQDGATVRVGLEQEPGSSGKAWVDYLIRKLAGYNVTAKRPTGDKITRAGPLSSQWQAGNISIVKGEWNDAFLSELESFPQGGHDDHVDSAGGSFEMLTGAVPPMIHVVGASKTDEVELDYGDDD